MNYTLHLNTLSADTKSLYYQLIKQMENKHTLLPMLKK